MRDSTHTTTDAEWASFSASLARLLRKTPTNDTFAIELPCDDDSGAAPYVQFCAYGPGRVRCEVASNEYAGEVLGIIDADNRASQNVIRKLGFAYWKRAPVQGDLRNLYRLHVGPVAAKPATARSVLARARPATNAR